MGYKPRRVRGGYNNIGGMGKLRLKAERVAVLMDGKENHIVFRRVKDVVPDYLLSNDAFPGGEYWITMSEDKKKLISVRPQTGMFQGRAVEIASKEGEEPAPKTVVSEWGEYLAFTVILKVLKPENQRTLTVPFRLRYDKFVEDEDGMTAIKYEPQGKYADQLAEFCDAAGVWKAGGIEWSSNILPELNSRIKKEKKVFGWLVKDGFVDSIFMVGEDVSEPKKSTGTEIEEWDDGEIPFE